MAWNARRDAIARHLLARLREDEHPGLILNEQADAHGRQNNFAAAVRCCRESYQLALTAHHLYAQGAARLHLGLHYFIYRGAELDRAANYCEEAARHFHTAFNVRGEGIAWLAVARIMNYACKQGKARQHHALSALLKAAMLLEREPDNLGDQVTRLYNVLAKSYGQRHAAPNPKEFQPPTAGKFTSSGMSSSGQSKSTDAGVTPQPNTNATNNATSSLTTQPSFRSAPHQFQWRFVLAGSFALLVFVLFVFARFGLTGGISLIVGALLLAMGVNVLLLYLLGQLVFDLPSHSVAVVSYRGRTWWVEESTGAHWLFPLLEQVIAFIPKSPRTVAVSLEEYVTVEGKQLVIRARVRYSIVDALRLWRNIASNIKKSRVLWFARPINSAQVATCVDERARLLLRETVSQLTAEGLVFYPGTELDARATAALSVQARPLGLHIEQAQIVPYVGL